MAKYGSSSVVVYLLDAPSTGASRNISNFLLTMGSLKLTSITEPSTAYGDSWEELLAAGMRKGEPVDLGGFCETDSTAGSFTMFYNNLPTSPAALPQGLVVAASTEKFFHADVYVTDFEVIAQVGKITQFKSRLAPTGACTWTTSTS